MITYFLRRLMLLFPTLIGILLVNFVIIQFAPGGPVEQMIAKIRGADVSAASRFGGGGDGSMDMKMAEYHGEEKYKGARGLDPEFIKDLERQFGFDKPAPERFWIMLKSYAQFDFGKSYFRDVSVVELLKEKLPVSISLGLWSTLLIYLISIPLGIRKALRDGSQFDTWTSAVIIVGYAIPGFLFAILLIVLFAGGSFFEVFPLKGIVSDNWHELSWFSKITDYFWHLVLPVTAMVISGFASLTLLTKNSFLEEIKKQYVLTARAKGLDDHQVLYGHVFRNAMLIVIAGMPAAFIHIFFTGSLLIEVIFSLDGIGLMGFESAISRDYPVVFGTLFIYTLIGLVLHIISDMTYMIVDPRIDFDKRMAQ